MPSNNVFSSPLTGEPKGGLTGRMCSHGLKQKTMGQTIAWPWFLLERALQPVFQGTGIPPDSWGMWETKLLPKARHCRFAGGHPCRSVGEDPLAYRISCALAWASTGRHCHPERRELPSYHSMCKTVRKTQMMPLNVLYSGAIAFIYVEIRKTR